MKEGGEGIGQGGMRNELVSRNLRPLPSLGWSLREGSGIQWSGCYLLSSYIGSLEGLAGEYHLTGSHALALDVLLLLLSNSRLCLWDRPWAGGMAGGW